MSNSGPPNQQDLQSSLQDLDQSLQAVAAAAAAAAAASGLQNSNGENGVSYSSAHTAQGQPSLSADDILNLVPTGSSPESANIIAAAAHAAAIAAAASNAATEHNAMEGGAGAHAQFDTNWTSADLNSVPSVAAPPPHPRIEGLSFPNESSGSNSFFGSSASSSSGPNKQAQDGNGNKPGSKPLNLADAQSSAEAGPLSHGKGVQDGSSSPIYGAEENDDDEDEEGESRQPEASTSAHAIGTSASSSRSRKRKLPSSLEEQVPSRVGTEAEQKEWRAVMQARLASMNTSSRHVQTTQKRFLEGDPELSQPLTICDACSRNKLPCYLAPHHPKCFSCVLKGETCSLALIRHSRKRKALAEQDTVLSQARTEYVNRWRALKQDLVDEARKQGADDLADLVQDRIGACIEEMESDLEAWVPKDPVAFLKSGKL